MAKPKAETFDRELADLPSDARWREWIRRVEGVLFASATPVSRDDLSRVLGKGVSVDLVIDDLAASLEQHAFEVIKIKDGWTLRTRPSLGQVIRIAADVEDQELDLNEFEGAVLAAIAYHQPITRDGLKDIFGKDISRDLIGRMYSRDLIATGPRSPQRGAPYTFVTTDQFLSVFGFESLQDLPDKEQMQDAGLLGS